MKRQSTDCHKSSLSSLPLPPSLFLFLPLLRSPYRHRVPWNNFHIWKPRQSWNSSNQIATISNANFHNKNKRSKSMSVEGGSLIPVANRWEMSWYETIFFHLAKCEFKPTFTANAMVDFSVSWKPRHHFTEEKVCNREKKIVVTFWHRVHLSHSFW